MRPLRYSVLPPPTLEELRGRRILELVRDYPELLGPLEAEGIDPGPDGSEVLGDILAREEASPEGFMAALRWRKGEAGEGGA